MLNRPIVSQNVITLIGEADTMEGSIIRVTSVSVLSMPHGSDSARKRVRYGDNRDY